MRSAAALLLCIVAAPAVRAEAPPEQLLSEADAARGAGDYAKAALLYGRLAGAGVRNEDVYYNIGTMQLQAGRRGEAILAFERALRVAPGDADAAWNLRVAQRGNVDKLVGAREEEPFLERLGARVPERSAALAFLALWAGGGALLVAARLRRRSGASLGGTGLVCLLVSVIPAALLYAAWARASVESAVVVSPGAAVREGPARDFRAAFEIHEGLKVRVLSRDRGYLRVHLPNGLEGWVAEPDAPVI